MARKEVTEIKYICDVCGGTCASPERSRWFKIVGRDDGYLCSNCFHQDLDKFRKWLYALGISVTYDCLCTQYPFDIDEAGFFEVKSVSREFSANTCRALRKEK